MLEARHDDDDDDLSLLIFKHFKYIFREKLTSIYHEFPFFQRALVLCRIAKSFVQDLISDHCFIL